MTGDINGQTALDDAHRANKPDAYHWLPHRLGFTLDDCYRNPILRGFHPDPSIVRVGEDYYIVNSSFVHFPGLPIFHSRDLVHWQVIGHAVENLAWSGLPGLPGGFGYWAPDISYYKGRFWVVATLRRNTLPYRLQMITSAAGPKGPWDQPKFLPLDGIDPSLFADEDGRRYILLNPGAILAEIDDAGNLISAPEMIYFGSARIKPEGPHLLKKDGWYYLFLAEGGTDSGHMETVARSKNLRGPYEDCPFNPILGRKNLLSPIQRSGHGKPVMLPHGRWMMAYLCGRSVEVKTVMGRETAIDPLTWTADGWPMVNALKGPSCLQKSRFLIRKRPIHEMTNGCLPGRITGIFPN
ncbi:MAG: glycoside hydrolase family 43 protein [Clostridia bacterium]|nr:glycoside hydrolase family 43 protein [Clostridia bacterium]